MNNKLFKGLSLLLAFIITITAIPIGELVAFAEEVKDGIVSAKEDYLEIKNFYVYENATPKFESSLISLSIGEKSPKAITVVLNSNDEKQLVNESISEIEGLYRHTGEVGIKEVKVDGISYSVGNSPSIVSRTPGYDVESTEELKLKLLNADENVKVSVTPDIGVEVESIKDNSVKLSFGESISGGIYGVILTKEGKEQNNVKVSFSNTFRNTFHLVGKLNISDDVKIIPNQGATDSEVTITGERLNDGNISVFFVPKNTFPKYQKKYRAEKVSWDRKKNELVVKVPKELDPGTHEVFITNDVNNINIEDLTSNVTAVATPENNIFVVLNSKDGGRIETVTPPKGPDTGIDIEIQGKNLGYISENIFNRIVDIDPIADKIEEGDNKLVVRYGGNDNKCIGYYTPILEEINSDKENSDEKINLKDKKYLKVKKIERELEVYIGARATFKEEGHKFTEEDDRLYLRTPSMTLDDEFEKHDVLIEIKTKVYPCKDEKTDPMEFTEKVKWNEQFTYELSKLAPKIENIVPKQIPVITITDDKGKIDKDITLYINGENFVIHRFKDKDGQINIKKPIVRFKDNFTLDPNFSGEKETTNGNEGDSGKESNLERVKADMKILDDRGRELDGESGRRIGSKIVVTIPAGTIVPKAIYGNNVTVTNPIIQDIPIKNGEDPAGLSSDSYSEERARQVDFVPLSKDAYPKITEINPEKIPTKGFKDAKITGTGFKPGVKVYIDGEEIKNVKLEEGGTSELTLDLPPKDYEGEYQIIVQNEDGGLDTIKVFYVKSEIDLKLSDFNPKEGTEGTRVMVTGQGFVRASNNRITELTELGLDRLIGTKVLLGNRDVNEYDYNLDEKTGKITLKGYSLQEPLFKVENNEVIASKEHASILLKEEGEDKAYYSVYFDINKREYKITDGASDEIIVNTKSFKDFDFSYEGQINYKDRTWKILTPYKVENKKITGHRVRIISPSELEFEVPKKQREGFYDVTVRNYDAVEDSKVGKNGFYYFFQPQSKPKIDKVVPDAGTVQGGYFIDIIGSGFIDNGFDQNNNPVKTSVTIGTVQVDPKDVVISSDGKKITVKVPPYPGDLSEEIEADRKDVNVTIVNHDGGSDTLVDGFSYRLPISNPKIYRVVKNKGSAAGEEEVIIEGSDFRFFEPYISGEVEKEEKKPEEKDKETSKEDGEKEAEEEKPEEKPEENNPTIDGNSGLPEGMVSYEDLNHSKTWDDIRKNASSEAKILIDGKEKTFKKKDDLTEEEWNKYIVPILPKIYFGSKQAEIIDWSGSGDTITVRTPKGEKGVVDVYLVNNDYGTSNSIKYTYEASNPTIKSITPPNGHKQGNESVEILGSGFQEDEVLVYDDKGETKLVDLVKIQFGLPKSGSDLNMTNRSIDLNDIGSGKISNLQAEAVAGNLKVNYNGVEKTIDVYLGEKGIDGNINIDEKSEKTYFKKNIKFDEHNEVFLPLEILKNSEGEKYKGKELVKLSVELEKGSSSVRRLYIDRGFAPEATAINHEQVMLKTPEFYTVGAKDLELTNPDGAKTKGEFEYINPDSNPSITEIKRDNVAATELENGNKLVRVSHTGGSVIEIIGQDFRRPVDIYIGGQKIEEMEGVQGKVEYEYFEKDESISTRIKFRMPAVSDAYADMKPLRVVVVNKDKGFATSEPYFIKFTRPESGEVIMTGIVPDSGPTDGGTVVTIHGDNFREKVEGYEDEKLKAYFERGNEIKEIPASDILSIEHDKIVLKTPPFEPGSVDVRVVNPDGSWARLLGGFTYVSAPNINNIVDPDNEKMQIKIISLEGGERIKLKGSQFMEGARVVFNPQLVEMPDNTPVGNGVIVIKGKKYRLESGYEGSEIDVVDSQNILVTTPPGNLGDKGVMVINPDNSASAVYELIYGIPEIGAPMDVDAEVMYDQFIRVSWTGVRDALEYEVYVSIDGGGFEFVGTTKWTDFIFEDIKSRTDYKFLVRAIGEYGTSKPIKESESPTVRTGSRVGPDDSDGSLGENTVINKHGDKGEVVIGDRDFGSNGMVIDLTSGQLAGVKDLTIRIPGTVITDYSSGYITVKGRDYHMNFNPAVFRNKRIDDNRRDSGVVFNIAPYMGPEGTSPRNTVASEKYLLKASTFVNSSETAIDQIAGQILFNLHKNQMIIQSRRLNYPSLSVYDDSRKDWLNVTGVQKMGLYSITGRRR